LLSVVAENAPNWTGIEYNMLGRKKEYCLHASQHSFATLTFATFWCLLFPKK
jgi:hypothetical protein